MAMCFSFATYSARSGGIRTGTLAVASIVDIVAIAYGTESNPEDLFTMEILLSGGKTYIVSSLDTGGNSQFVSNWCLGPGGQ